MRGKKNMVKKKNGRYIRQKKMQVSDENNDMQKKNLGRAEQY